MLALQLRPEGVPMSHVTSVLVLASILDDEQLVQTIEIDCEWDPNRLISLRASMGGAASPQAPGIWGGSFNGLNHSKLILDLLAIKWKRPGDLQVLLMFEHGDRWEEVPLAGISIMRSEDWRAWLEARGYGE